MHELLAAAEAIGPDVIADRRAIHEEPELMYEVHKTAGMVAQRLEALGIEAKTGVGRSGVVGILRGAGPGKTVLLRGDMDALPIVEENDYAFCSKNRGIMHACGHDAHTAVLMGAARLLAERRDRFEGTVKFMFQPAEEGGAGALRMIEDGLLDDPKVDAAFAIHVDAFNYTGQICLRPGASHAAADEFSIVIRGKGGHAARPHAAVDPIVIASQIVTALQTLSSREISPLDPVVITVGRLVAGTAFNVIPETALIEGTIRSYSQHVQDLVERRLQAMVKGIAEAMRAAAEIDYRRLYPPLYNHAEGIALLREVVTDVLSPEAVVEGEQGMGSEDFAFVLQKVPGAMFRLGVRHKDWKTIRPTHSALFDMDESALPLGVAVMAGTALRYLETK